MHDSLTGLTLAIASGHDLSLAVLDGDAVVAERHMLLERGHNEHLMPELRALLHSFGGSAMRPERIVVEIGPGSFTGLRIGIAAARALGLAWDCPVFGVRSTLLVAAQAASAGVKGRVLAVVAAPRGQVWLEAFDLPGLESLGSPISVLPEEAAVRAFGFAAISGNSRAIAAAGHAFHEFAPLASSVALVPPVLWEAPTPLYVRPGEALAAA